MLKFNETLDRILVEAGGKLYLATLDREALERFVRAMLADIERELKEWHDAEDESMKDDPFWDGYKQGMVDAIVAVRLWAQDIE